jgi:hypothetical protein
LLEISLFGEIVAILNIFLINVYNSSN